MIGYLLYQALISRIDILALVSVLARFQNSPTAFCHHGAERVLRYVCGTSDFCILYESGGTCIQAFVDCAYAADTADRKSVSGYLVKIGTTTRLWGAKKQATVALSICESDHYGMNLAAKKYIWMKRVLIEANVMSSKPNPLLSDNQCAIRWARGERCPSARAKDTDFRVHFIMQLVSESQLEVAWVAIEENHADMLTKSLGPI